MTTALRTTTALSLGALALAGTLAGCSSAASAGSGGTTDTSPDTTANANASYKDGTYTADGTYQSPGGTESIEVKLTIADNAVSAVTVTGTPSSIDAQNYQGQFEANISAAIVGKKLSELNVSKVAGSSLTSEGFNAALADIESQAAA